MIEILKEEPLRDTDTVIPKNIRQIGEVDDATKVYIEDYVVTYMKQLAAYGEQIPKAMILYGKKEYIEETCYWFVSGAISITELDLYSQQVLFGEKEWHEINEKAGKYFSELYILGWVLLKQDADDDLGKRVLKTHEEFFRRDQQIFMEYLTDEKMENLYFYQSGDMKPQSGYYIYYEKNDPMQSYMLNSKEDKPVEIEIEEEHRDQATMRFRETLQEKKEHVEKKKTTSLLYGVSAILVMVIMVIGITMVNNYEKMQDMEKVLYQLATLTSNRKEDADNKSEIEAQKEILSTSTQGVDADKSEDEKEKGQDVSEESANEKSADDVKGDFDNKKNDKDSSDDKDSNNKDASDGDASKEKDKEADKESDQTDKESDKKSDQADKESDKKSDQAEKDAGKDADQEANNESDKDKTKESGGMVTTIEGSAEEAPPQKVEEEKTEPVYQSYVIQKGDTLAKISTNFYGTTKRINDICALNGIQDKDNIQYGKKILLPN